MEWQSVPSGRLINSGMKRPGILVVKTRDYVLLYFLFADAVQPFVDAIHAGYTEGNPVFDKIMKRVEDHLNTNAKAG